MKILVTGVGGQLGHDVMNELIGRGHTGVGSDIAPEYSGVADGSAVTTAEYVPMDITDAAQVSEVITKVSPDVVIHCAAWTAVDAAEDDDKKAKVKAINADGTQNIANVCKQLDCKMVYISTDYVFDGTKTGEYSVDDVKHPLSVYGKSKSDAEDIVLQANEGNCVLRISWLFGPSKKNFVETIINAAQLRSTLQVVDDLVGTPTYTEDLAVLIDTIIQKRCSGILHATNEGFCTWADFAQEILMVVHSKTVVQRITSAEYSSKAVRPKNSRLSKSCLDQYDLPRLPTWQDALKRYLSKRMQMEE